MFQVVLINQQQIYFVGVKSQILVLKIMRDRKKKRKLRAQKNPTFELGKKIHQYRKYLRPSVQSRMTCWLITPLSSLIYLTTILQQFQPLPIN